MAEQKKSEISRKYAVAASVDALNDFDPERERATSEVERLARDYCEAFDLDILDDIMEKHYGVAMWTVLK